MRICHTVCLVVFTFASIHLSFAQAPAGGVFQRYDRNGDGKVTPDELPDKATFARFDLNKDGAITLEEYNQVAGGATPAGPSKPKQHPLATPARRRLLRRWMVQPGGSQQGREVEPSGSPQPPVQAAGHRRRRVRVAGGIQSLFSNRQALKMLDKDGDGKISQTEFNKLYQDAEHLFRQHRQEAQPADGRTLPVRCRSRPIRSACVSRRTISRHERPARLDMAATEANHLAVHRGHVIRQLQGDLSQSADARSGL